MKRNAMLSKTFFLMAAVPSVAEHLPICACLAADFGFSIDCSAQDKIQESYDAAMADCFSDCSSEPCRKNFAIVEAHHDSCSHANVPLEVELGFHDLEKSCGHLCRIGLSDVTACPGRTCNDADEKKRNVLDILKESDCVSDCAVATCQEAYGMLLRRL